MTAEELIRQLQSFPPETKVVVRGFEDGYNDILKLKALNIKAIEKETHWFDGEYEKSDEPDAIGSIYLYGENKNPTGDK